MKVAILGAQGQFGRDVQGIFGARHETVGFSHADIDVTSERSVERGLRTETWDVVINCAAYTGVDQAESEPRAAFDVNSVGALNVARICALIGCLCVYVSTDYVFDGDKSGPYVESDTPNPVNVYGSSKQAGERLVAQACPRWLVARLAGLFGGGAVPGSNFVETVIAKAGRGERLEVVGDVSTSFTYGRDAATMLETLVVGKEEGNFHLANAGECSWYGFAKAIFEELGMDHEMVSSSAAGSGRAAVRPSRSILASERLGEMGVSPPSWRDGLREYLRCRSHLHGNHTSL